MKIAVAAVAVLALCQTQARAETLYDSSLPTTPGFQAWVSNIGLTTATESKVGANPLQVDTTNGGADNSVQAGYGRVDKVLNRVPGFTLDFQLQITGESHDGTNGPDRAGFSIIVLSSDNGGSGTPLGIELAFWEDQVWAQTAAFVHGTGAAYDTTAALVDYQLTVQGANWSLTENGNPLLNGALVQYPSGIFVGPLNIYATPNFIFLGDDTTSARATWELGDVVLTNIPEPASLMLLAIGGLAIARRRAA